MGTPPTQASYLGAHQRAMDVLYDRLMLPVHHADVTSAQGGHISAHLAVPYAMRHLPPGWRYSAVADARHDMDLVVIRAHHDRYTQTQGRIVCREVGDVPGLLQWIKIVQRWLAPYGRRNGGQHAVEVGHALAEMQAWEYDHITHITGMTVVLRTAILHRATMQRRGMRETDDDWQEIPDEDLPHLGLEWVTVMDSLREGGWMGQGGHAQAA